MNRRKMLALSTGVAFAGLNSASIAGQALLQSESVRSEGTPLWFLHEDELKTGVNIPSTKIAKTSIVTNRGDFPPPYDKLIRKAEAVYPYLNPGLKGENGRPLWYLAEDYKVPFNVTMRAVNYFFDLAKNDKRRKVTYRVDKFELVPVSEVSTDTKSLYDLPIITEVSLLLGYSANYGNTGGESLGAWKRVFFRDEEIIALYMSPKPQVVMS